jgi:ribosomal protein S18 acetylase RimI-like enzyme
MFPYQLANSLHEWPEHVRRITHASGPEQVADFIRVIAKSFCGTTRAAPEGTFDWWLGREHRSGEALYRPLAHPPSGLRAEFFEWWIGLIAHRYMDYGGCFALTDPASGSMLAAFIAVPPHDRAPDAAASAATAREVVSRWLRQPPPDPGAAAAARGRVISAQMPLLHTRAAPRRHWYLACIATDPALQGGGHGATMLQFLNKLADADGVELYLEATGARNCAIYERFGYAVCEKLPLLCRQGSPQTYGPSGVKEMGMNLREDGNANGTRHVLRHADKGSRSRDLDLEMDMDMIENGGIAAMVRPPGGGGSRCNQPVPARL